MTTVAQELDDWAGNLQALLGVNVTRDPDLVHPPCVFVGLPEVVTSPFTGGQVLNLPVYVVCGGSGKQQGDELLNLLPTVLNHTGQTEAAQTSITIGDIPFTAYQITVPVRLDLPQPVAPSAPGMPVAVNWKKAEPGWYTFTLTWNPSTTSGSSPILYYRVNVDGNEQATDGPVIQIDNLRAQAGQTAEAFVYAVNSQTAGPPSETGYLTAPPTQ